MISRMFLMFILITALVGCAGQPVSTTESAADAPLQTVQLGVGFVPNIQFAPFYVAQAQGFYAEEGLDVSLEYGFENDFVALTARGERQFAIASGDQVVLGRAQGLPIVYVMKWYDRFPVAVVAPQDSGITTPADLEGHSVGIPGLFGASYVAWKALAYATDLNEDAVALESIGFTQAEAVSTQQVDAAVVYVANEPILLAQQGIDLNMFEVSDHINLVSNGLVTNEQLLADDPDLVARMIRASLRGLQYTIDNPDESFDLARTFIPEMTEEDVPTQKQVLAASITLWESDTPGLTSETAWQESVDFMVATGLLEAPVAVESLYSNEFVAE